MSVYARNTKVSVSNSQGEIQSALRRYGVDSFGTMEKTGSAAILFEIGRLGVRIEVPIPQRDEKQFTETATGRECSESAAFAKYEQAVRQRWRSLLLAIKAKLEAVDSGISTIQQEFMPFVVMPDGRVFGDHVLPQLEEIASTGKMPKLLTVG